MKVIEDLSATPKFNSPFVITIGNYDGFHLGHQLVLRRVISLAQQKGCLSAAISFKNHPAEVLKPDHPITRLGTVEHKILLMEKIGIDFLFLLPFTKELSLLTAEQFLQEIRKRIPFSHLILGYDASFGNNKEGNQQVVENLAKEMGFHVEYLPPLLIDQKPISSSRIRLLIEKGDFFQCEQLLGRKYSIFGPVIQDKDGTARMDVHGLCLPPPGIYDIEVNCKGNVYKGEASIEVASTDRICFLKLDLLDSDLSLDLQSIEIIFTLNKKSQKEAFEATY